MYHELIKSRWTRSSSSSSALEIASDSGYSFSDLDVPCANKPKTSSPHLFDRTNAGGLILRKGSSGDGSLGTRKTADRRSAQVTLTPVKKAHTMNRGSATQ